MFLESIPGIPTEIQLPALTGAVLSLLISVVVQSPWPGWVKGIIVLASSAVVGAISAASMGQLTGRTWGSAVLIVAVFTIGSYRYFWKPTGIGPKLEQLTNWRRDTSTENTKP